MPFAERLHRVFQLVLLLSISAIILSASDLILPEEKVDWVRRYTRPVEFDYFDWTVGALAGKLGQAALDTPFYFEAPARLQVVRDYLHLVDQVLQAEYQLNLVYSDPQIDDPVIASANIRQELEELNNQLGQLSPLAEAVLESQVSEVLTDLDLTLGGQPVPPVLFHISPLPYHLIISPREKIQQDLAISLLPDLTVDLQAGLEERITAGLDVSCLVVPVGGIGSYPTMVMRTTSLEWLADTISHEWIHNWLSLHPLGFNYSTSPELRTMNETTASIAGAEIAGIILQRFYPTLSEYYSIHSITYSPVPFPSVGASMEAFDFRAEMHATRLRVDELLSEGKVEEAEGFMENRRLVFWENGYPIRKLNQAYFAFYGAYADSPGGPAGEDPVGPAVRLLRAQSDSLTGFLKKIASMSSFADLLKAVSP